MLFRFPFGVQRKGTTTTSNLNIIKNQSQTNFQSFNNSSIFFVHFAFFFVEIFEILARANEING